MRKGHATLGGLALVCVLITACGGSEISIPTVAPTATVNIAATSTRTTELAAATSTRTAELATALAPTAMPLPTDTPVPPTATPAATATPPPAATATRASDSTATTIRPTVQATPAGSTARAPLGAAPSGWKTYTGSPRMPFAMYYPPDWTVDESEATTAGRIVFQSPSPTIIFQIGVDTKRTTLSIDTVRDAQAKALAGGCKASGVESTAQETYSGIIFDELVQTCDLGQPPLFAFGVGAGLNNGYPWAFVASGPHDSIQEIGRTTFQPMLDSLHIYGNPVG